MTAPLFLRRLDPEADAPALHAIFGDEASCRFLAGPAVATVAETREMLASWTRGHEDTSWAIVDDMHGPALGRVSFYGGEQDVWNAAVMTCPQHRGRNLAARALAIAIDEMFDRRGARRISADVDPDNAASAALFQRLGFRLEGRLRGTWLTHIGQRDSLIFGLLRDDPRPWRRHKTFAGS